jgi:hypothetical protein
MDAFHFNSPSPPRKSIVGYNIRIVIAPRHHSLGGVILIRYEKLQELQESGPNISEKEAGGFCEG